MIHLLAVDTPAHVGVLRDYWNTVTDPAHIGAELTWTVIVDVGILTFAVPFSRRWLRRHDREQHGNG